MLPQRFAIKNVQVWNANGVTPNCDVIVDSGLVAEIRPTGGAAILPDTVFDGAGKVLLPSGIDLQTHLRVPGQPEKELPVTGLKAALRGGYAAVLTMPNTKPVIDTPDVCARALNEVAPAETMTGVKVFLSAAMTMGQEGRVVVDGVALAKAGVKALTDDGRGVASDDIMDAVFKEGERCGLPLLQHAEVPGHGGVLAPGPTQSKLGIPAYDEAAETKMVERDIACARRHPKARYHVLHVSAAKSIDLIKAARKEGLKVTGEATPHHLHFTSEAIPAGQTSFKMNPPIRGESDKRALRKALAAGDLEFLSTDHAPHEPKLKGEDFQASAFGTTVLEVALRVLVEMYKSGELSPERLVDVFSTAPARFIGEDKEFGHIAVGRPFRATWLDVDAPSRKVEMADLESLSKNCCFLGEALPGKVLGVFNPAGLFRF